MKKKTVTSETEEITIDNKKQKRKREKKAYREIRWDRLDNTAHLFPVIAGENMSNVYRISVTLTELVQPDILQQALNIVLPKMDGFNLRLRMGVFWYYFEENGKPAPKVREESNFPCRYIQQNQNHSYMFRVTYYKYRINLEVFHVLTDGIKNYKKSSAKGYQTKKAYLLKGEHLGPGEFGVMHGYMQIPQLKEVCHRYGCSINEYLVSVYIWSVYTECMKGMPSASPIRVAVPVNLRPYFNSITTKNFFVMVSAEFHPTKEVYTFAEVLAIVRDNLRSQINREHLEKLFSYNVSNEKLLAARAVPLFLKNIAMKLVYTKSALANTTTITNIGNIGVDEEYRPYVEMFHAFLAMSKGQHLKGTICSYGSTLVFSFSFDLKDVSVQRGFFRKIAADGIEVELDTNGVTAD